MKFITSLFLLLAAPSSLGAADGGVRGHQESSSRELQDAGEVIDGAFIVELDDSVDDVAALAASLLQLLPGAELLHVYENALKGFAVGGLAAGLVDTLGLNPLVTAITQVSWSVERKSAALHL